MSLRSAHDIVQQLQNGRRMLADGAVGSELIRSGIAAASTVEANQSHPERVLDLHRRAIVAGAEIITSNTFGSADRYEWATAFQAGLELAATAAREAGAEIGVLLSVYPEELLRRADIVLAPFREPGTQGCLLLIETATDIREAVQAVVLAVQASDALIAATCHFQSDGNMPDGTTPAQAAQALQQAGASIVGGNCGAVPEEMVNVAQQMRLWTDLPLLFQPNAGLPQSTKFGPVYPVDPDRFAANAIRLFDVGVSIVGGCCGTTPAHITAVRRLLFPQCRE